MTPPVRHLKLTIDEYLRVEDGADIRHEYIDGDLYAMTGASRNHVLTTIAKQTIQGQYA